MSKEPKLKPCPFCGEAPVYVPAQFAGTWHYAECKNAGCASQPAMGCDFESLLAKWNTRAEHIQSLDEIVDEACVILSACASAHGYMSTYTVARLLGASMDAYDLAVATRGFGEPEDNFGERECRLREGWRPCRWLEGL